MYLLREFIRNASCHTLKHFFQNYHVLDVPIHWEGAIGPLRLELLTLTEQLSLNVYESFVEDLHSISSLATDKGKICLLNTVKDSDLPDRYISFFQTLFLPIDVSYWSFMQLPQCFNQAEHHLYQDFSSVDRQWRQFHVPESKGRNTFFCDDVAVKTFEKKLSGTKGINGDVIVETAQLSQVLPSDSQKHPRVYFMIWYPSIAMRASLGGTQHILEFPHSLDHAICVFHPDTGILELSIEEEGLADNFISVFLNVFFKAKDGTMEASPLHLNLEKLKKQLFFLGDIVKGVETLVVKRLILTSRSDGLNSAIVDLTDEEIVKNDSANRHLPENMLFYVEAADLIVNCVSSSSYIQPIRRLSLTMPHKTNLTFHRPMDQFIFQRYLFSEKLVRYPERLSYSLSKESFEYLLDCWSPHIKTLSGSALMRFRPHCKEELLEAGDNQIEVLAKNSSWLLPFGVQKQKSLGIGIQRRQVPLYWEVTNKRYSYRDAMGNKKALDTVYAQNFQINESRLVDFCKKTLEIPEHQKTNSLLDKRLFFLGQRYLAKNKYNFFIINDCSKHSLNSLIRYLTSNAVGMSLVLTTGVDVLEPVAMPLNIFLYSIRTLFQFTSGRILCDWDGLKNYISGGFFQRETTENKLQFSSDYRTILWENEVYSLTKKQAALFASLEQLGGRAHSSTLLRAAKSSQKIQQIMRRRQNGIYSTHPLLNTLLKSDGDGWYYLDV